MTTETPHDKAGSDVAVSLSDSDPHAIGWSDLMDQTLRQPRVLFGQIAAHPKVDTPTLIKAIGVMVSAHVVANLAQHVWRNEPLTDATWPVIGTVIGTVFAWWSVVSTLNWVAHAFTGKNRWRCLATLTALSSLPWLLYAPLALIKTALPAIGPAFSPLLALGLWGWQWTLFFLAVANTFGLNFKRTLAVLLAPFSLSVIYWLWLGQFFENVSRILP